MRFRVFISSVQREFAVERPNYGTEFIIEKCEAQGLSTPQYKPDSALFHTVIWRKSEHKPVAHQVACQKGQVEGTSLTPLMGGVVAQSNGPVVAQSWPSRVFEAIAAVGEASTSDLARALALDNSSGSLKRALRILVFDGIIEYTIPEKPRSRLQKYRLTPKGRQMLVQKGTTLL